MPTYEYVCRNCGHGFDVVQSMSDESLAICDECGGELRKVFAPPAISFKGSGFYATDHGKEEKNAREKPAEKTGGSTEKGEKGETGGSTEKGETGGSTEKGEKGEKKEPKPSDGTGSTGSKGSSTTKETTST